MSGLRVAVVGATGTVGRAMLAALRERDFPADEVIAAASADSAGRWLAYGDDELQVVDADALDFSGIQLALFAAGSEVSARLVPRATEAGCLVVDNASLFRMEPDVPLVVPEVNADALSVRPPRGIVANPNCSTIQLVLVLAPILRSAGLEQVRVATYQAVSGAGRAASEALEDGLASALAGEPADPAGAAMNVVPLIGELDGEGHSTEEAKVMRETRRILGTPDLGVSATCVRVPVRNGHSEAVWLRTARPLSPEEARSLLAEAPGVLVWDGPEGPRPLSMGPAEDRALVGRIRRDPADPAGLALWVVADNVRKGAATNAVQIGEILVKSYL